MMVDKTDNLRQAYLNLRIGTDEDCDKVWVKKLKNILQSDIHSKPLGCKVDDTHIRIGEVHLGAFFEAQILFSHRYWVNRFADWLTERIIEKNKAPKLQKKNIVLVGYETYVEPVLYKISRNLDSHIDKKSGHSAKYLIFEEKKYIQAERTTEKCRFRYIDELDKDALKDTLIVYICGISSTLTTFNRMIKELMDYFKIENDSLLSHEAFSIIQVLPKNHNNSSYEFKDSHPIKWKRDENHINIIERDFLEKDENNKTDRDLVKKQASHIRHIQTEYLADVYCEWQNAYDCKWCYPEKASDERPIIATSETSVIPTQMIRGYCDNKVPEVNGAGKENKTEDKKSQPNKINFFAKRGNAYKYKKYLYYDHIDRDGHHYQYYIRTGHLFRKIFNDYINNDDKGELKEVCNDIKAAIGGDDIHKFVNVIVSPRHFSDEMFPQAVNELVFDNKAHVISLDIKKEYRSNFNTKYSNFAYFLEQVKTTNGKIKFYFVDDQIISGATFYRAKSLVTSLMKENNVNETANGQAPNSQDNSLEIFAGVIVLVNRMSDSSKCDYIPDINRFCSFIDIAIPSIRSYGDSCPICKLNQDAKEYQRTSALCSTARHWAQRQQRHCLKSLSEAKARQQRNENKDTQQPNPTDDDLIERHFNRLAIENILWQGYRRNNTYVKGIGKYDNKNDVLGFFVDVVNDNTYYKSIDLIVSFIKAISRAFIYYKENAKKAALKILISLIEYVSNDDFGKAIEIEDKAIEPIVFDSGYEKYTLLVTLINALASIDSTYMLDIDRIIKMYNCVLDWQTQSTIIVYDKHSKTERYGGNVCSFIDSGREYFIWKVSNKKFKTESFYSIILNAYKRIICGISGEQKLERFIESVGNYNTPLYRKDKRIEHKGAADTEFTKRELYDLTLFKAIMLESIKDDKTDVKDKIADIIEKYKSLSKELINKTEDKGAKINIIKFYYYDRDFGDNLIELTDEERTEPVDFADILQIKKDDPCRKNKNLEIKSVLSCNGFYNEDNRWIICLRHYESSCFDDNAPQLDTKAVYLVFDFSVDKDDADYKAIFKQIKTIRNVLRYRYLLTSIIDRDGHTGAIKSAIQAKKAQELLDSGKTIMHGGNEDFLQIADITYREIERNYKLHLSDEIVPYDFVQICDMANSMMDMFISYANTVLIRKEYFKITPHNYEEPFLCSVQRLNDCSDKKRGEIATSLIREYVKEIANPQSEYLKHIAHNWHRQDISINDNMPIKLLFKMDGKEIGVDKITSFSDNIKLLPNMLKVLDSYKACIFIVAVIDLLLRNAVKHGQWDNGTLFVELCLSTKGGYDNDFELSMKNKKRSSPHVANKDSITWRFLGAYIDGLNNSSSNSNKYSFTKPIGKPTEDDCFTATMSCEFSSDLPSNVCALLDSWSTNQNNS